jgi:hypothetical protein
MHLYEVIFVAGKRRLLETCAKARIKFGDDVSKELSISTAIDNYNRHMGGVDIVD